MTNRYQPGMRISEYVLVAALGRGSFAEVWRARHHVWDSEHVAIKLPLDASSGAMLGREGILVHGLRHPNIVRVLGLDPYAEVPYLVMELVRGPSLRGALEQSPEGIGVGPAVAILRGMMLALEHAHSKRVLHRDLKPGNVLLRLEERGTETLTPEDVLLSDFGLGLNHEQTAAAAQQSASLDRAGKLVGTLAYLAPELRDGEREPDERSDLYAAGVILFESLTGRRPAGAEQPSNLQPTTPPWLDEIFRSLYARHERRAESARSVLDVLDRHAVRVSPPPLPPAIHRSAPAARTAGDQRGQTAVAARGVGRSRCPGCKSATRDSDQFCIACGRQLVERVRRCSACGGFPGVDDVYCILCGDRLDA